MRLDPDAVPRTFDEAVEALFRALGEEERRWFVSTPQSTSVEHHGVGRFLRNSWSLWERETVLVQWFRQNLRVGHADDISGLILDGLVAKVMGVPFDPENAAKRYHEHWKKYGCNEFGEPL